MVGRSVALAAGALTLVAGAAVAGSAAQAAPTAPVAVAPVAPAPAAAGGDAGDAGDAELAALATDTEKGAAGAHRKLACARVPNAVTRTQNLQKRLAADASTRGSLAWLGAKVAAAEKADRAELATTLKNRLAFRTELAQFLPHRLALLQKASSTVCAPGAAATS
jgi:hypothetical protein